jgi:hypothetical protein
MTQQNRHKAVESWEYHRTKYLCASRSFPYLAVYLPLIDRVCELGYSEKLYALSSHDNLVISVRRIPYDRRQTILVIPQENTIEFRLYPRDGEAEIITVVLDQAVPALDRLLPRLTAKPERSSRRIPGGDFENRTKPEDFRVDIGRADKGKTFVRVVHVPSGKERHLVGLGHENTHDVTRRLIEELITELEKNN